MKDKRLVTCGEHGERQPCVAVCKHVLDGGAIGFVNWPPDDGSKIGSIGCAGVPGSKHAADDLIIICVTCAKRMLDSRATQA